MDILDDLIKKAINEDVGDGDHTSLATVKEVVEGKMKLLVKDKGIIAGIDVAKRIYNIFDPQIILQVLIQDGSPVNSGDIAFFVHGPKHTLLTAERTVLNFMQRMSGIASETQKYTEQLRGTKAVLLDTRKTTPNMRIFEKMAVKLGGGENHRMGLYDMIMIKDNHVDFSGGIKNAITRANEYLTRQNLNLKIEIEVRSFEELKEVLKNGGVHRIMLDNFSPENLKKAVEIIGQKFETEASGGITLSNIREYAVTGVDYISVGAITHHIKSLDLSLKVVA